MEFGTGNCGGNSFREKVVELAGGLVGVITVATEVRVTVTFNIGLSQMGTTAEEEVLDGTERSTDEPVGDNEAGRPHTVPQIGAAEVEADGGVSINAGVVEGPGPSVKIFPEDREIGEVETDPEAEAEDDDAGLSACAVAHGGPAELSDDGVANPGVVEGPGSSVKIFPKERENSVDDELATAEEGTVRTGVKTFP